MEEVVQYIIVRKDLEMSHGKMAAQVAHASLASVYPFMEDEFVKEWLSKKFTKIILKVKSLTQLGTLAKKLQDANIIGIPIVDNCRTELEKETEEGTWTCIGIKPYPKDMLTDILKKYQLYS